jgi:hypothetical protein
MKTLSLVLVLLAQVAWSQRIGMPKQNDSVNPDVSRLGQLSQDEVEALVKRVRGQTQFAIKQNHFPRPLAKSARSGRAVDTNSNERQIQESDIFKIGAKGSKELFLLNNYRGFQIISFEEGIQFPAIKSRLPIYNNWSSEMYFLEQERKVIVLNTEWHHQSFGGWKTQYKTVMYIIDVKDTASPKVLDRVETRGRLEQSRMVGDVLYLVSSNGDWSQRVIELSSFKLQGKSIKKIQSKSFGNEKNNRGWVRELNVVKAADRYFVLFNQSRWNNGGDYVSVVDITDPKGQLKSILTAKIMGNIRERSQMFIHDGHLVAISNFRKDRNSLSRIGLEAFELKVSQDIVRAHPKKQMSVGDTNGLHANLQDVRVSGDQLYVFWVPANNIDPFDLFDMSNLSNGFTYQGRLYFDGWISKAFPIQYQGEKFILGLGWVVPATASDNRRVPQAKLFKLDQVGDKVVHREVSTVLIENEKIWANLNRGDKYFEILAEGDGRYKVLFPVSFRNPWRQGAKLVELNLATQDIREGASLIANQNWLKRVFNNPEILAINGFSDLELETFDIKGAGDDQFVKSVSVLELARNIIDFHIFDYHRALYARQIVQFDNRIELRTFPMEMADGEKAQALDIKTIEGKVFKQIRLEDSLILLMGETRKIKKEQKRGSWPSYRYEVEMVDQLKLIKIDTDDSLQAGAGHKVMASFTPKELGTINNETSQIWGVQLLNLNDGLFLQLNNKHFRFLPNNETKIKQLKIEKSCQYFLKGQLFKLSVYEGELLLSNQFKWNGEVKTVPSGNRYSPVPEYYFPFVKRATIKGPMIKCSSSTNLPGIPIEKISEQLVLSSQTNQNSICRGCCFGPQIDRPYIGRPGPWFTPDRNSFVLRWGQGQAILTDKINVNLSQFKVAPGRYLSFESKTGRVDLWRVGTDGLLSSRPQNIRQSSYTGAQLLRAIDMGQDRTGLLFSQRQKLFLYVVDADHLDLEAVGIESELDWDQNDGMAEGASTTNTIRYDRYSKAIYLSQGLRGVLKINIK